MQDIAKEAKVSVGNLYNRFADREELIDEVINNTQREVYEELAAKLGAQTGDYNLLQRLEILADAFYTSTRNTKPFFLSIASRQISKSSRLPRQTATNAQDIVTLFSDWLMASESEVVGDDKLEKCRFVASSLAFVLQFDAVFGTPSRMFGEELIRKQVAMSYSYLTH